MRADCPFPSSREMRQMPYGIDICLDTYACYITTFAGQAQGRNGPWAFQGAWEGGRALSEKEAWARRFLRIQCRFFFRKFC